MKMKRPSIPPLFCHTFTVDASAPFRRHLNRLEVEIGREDYRHLKRVELLSQIPSDGVFASMDEITRRVLDSTQNLYNRDLLLRLGIRVYLDAASYSVYYRLDDRALRFTAAWRRRVLKRFFAESPIVETGWRPCDARLPHFECRFLPDGAGGVLLLRLKGKREDLPLITATHGPYDPHTLEAALYFLTTERGGAAIINLGFSGREPLSDENLAKLRDWGIPLNPSNIDVIYPYADASGHPYCYKLEEGLQDYMEILGEGLPQIVIDLHGCVGVAPDDRRLVVGLGGLPPYRRPQDFGALEARDEMLLLRPDSRLRRGLDLLKGISDEICIQFCSAPDLGYSFLMDEEGTLVGRLLDPHTEAKSLIPGEERTWLPEESVRWIPGAGGNALQRMAAHRMRKDALCLHVEIPTALRRRIALRLKEEAIAASLDASGL